MARRPKKWPTYALDSLEGTLFHLKGIIELTREAQVAAKEGDRMMAVILNGDIRERAQDAVHLLIQARVGNYECEHDPTVPV